MKKYRKKPVIIEAKIFETNNEPQNENMTEIVMWVNQGRSEERGHAWHNGTNIYIKTLEGVMTSHVGDYIIKGVKGEFYPCKPDIFKQTYEEV